MGVISSPRNPRLIAARRLGRRPHEHVLAEGPQVVAEALRAACRVEVVYATPTARERFADVLAGAHVEEVSERAMSTLAATEAPQGVVAVVRNPAVALADLVGSRPRRVLVLTDVRDPGNVGTAIRAAEGAGFEAAVVCSGSCDPANAKAVRASAGAVFHLRHAARVAPEEALAALEGWRRLGAEPTGNIALADLRVEGPVAVVVGNEAWGFTPSVSRLLDDTVTIPMRGRVTSLNAGVAAALVAYRVTGGCGGKRSSVSEGPEREAGP